MNNLARLGAKAARVAMSAIRNQGTDSIQQGMSRGLFTGKKIEQKVSQTTKDRVLEETKNHSSMTMFFRGEKRIFSRQAREGSKTDIRHSKVTSGNTSKFSNDQLSTLAQSAKESYETSKSTPSQGKLTLSQAVMLNATKESLPLKTQAALARAIRAYHTSSASIKPLQDRTGSVG
ncbi:MAG: hypothetical protein ACRCV3_02430 [Desulfovibrionaceae bacterium]